jgi:hypothetical protein
MRKKMYILFIVVSIVLVSCNKKADKETVNKMADGVCNAMALIVDEDPMSIIEAHSALLKIQENEQYGKVTENQLLTAMKEKCPEGAEKYTNLVTETEEEPGE